MILIIAEKPSLGRNIAAGVELLTKAGSPMRKCDGYLEGNGYIITWAFGHLFSLVDIEAYGDQPAEEKARWTMDNLPCFPETFRFELRRDNNKRPDAGVRKQFETIKRLCNRPDVDTLVNAGDADREGEIIVRLCLQNAAPGNKKMMRLWLPDQTPETVAKALEEMQPEAAYDLLAGEGFARTYIDWLYGVNLTRYATLRTGSLLRVGRVIVPIVKAIYDRDMAIRNFVPGHYLALASHAETGGEEIELTGKNKYEENQTAEAEAVCRRYNEAGAVVLAVKNKKETLFPGKLYSLSKLQNVLGKKYKMSMAESLEIIQKLYEEGFLTYPRTNSEYLATAEQDKVKKILGTCAKMGYPVEFKNSKTIFDDSKIESHSALTPTYKIPDKNRLSEREMQVYSTVFRRFVAVFCAAPCTVSRSEMTIRVGDPENGGEDFVLKGTVMLEQGWTKYDDYSGKDKILPKLAKGDAVNVDFRPEPKETTPPKHCTIETLNNYLKNPFKEDKAAAADEDDTEEYRAIFEGLELGTEATRTGIIDNARKSEYIQLKKDVYTILPGGEFLIESLAHMEINMDKYKTSELGKALKAVYHGKMTVDESVGLARHEIAEIFDRSGKTVEVGQDKDIGFFGDVVGRCPLCGQPVRRMRSFYGCSGYKDGCRFSVNTYICGRAISAANVRLLLEEGKTALIEGFKSKKGSLFSARLVVRDGRAVFDFSDRPFQRGTGAVALTGNAGEGSFVQDPALPPGMAIPPDFNG